ncbi:hypothetical protein CHLNCDRAFT_145228 [Chlorella variabilis]|uniref:PUB domain-containing protein n=1 Tax=Chlorella variabilis TaxID=554065 RepID=E1ZDZ2_CHLVA|nr:hypothetical protein CHLNCDRAFT_145228 [Chlorella variabilis]EFN55941.1 hypothetical protein CHLNCDRAFT_145228 [Chlorella variabilis]|eukprot:XP_005848043.1 hypothetical protein CHLNCDRAFT_145228 [Chlorella variabilis]
MSTEEVSGQGEPGVAAQAASHLAAALARQPPPPVPIPLDVKHQEAKFKEARARMIKIVNWQLNDDKHRKLEQILDTTQYLQKICGNVKDNPQEAKFRRIRITNATFSRHVRDAPGGEEFMHAAGWTVKVDNFEKYFVFEPQPGSLEWRILEEACAELSKLSALIDGKIKRGLGDKKALQERMRQQVRVAIEEDKAQREVIFQAHTAPVEAQPLPPSPRSRAQAGRGGGDL